MSTETDSGIQAGIRESRMRVARSRGVLSGIVLIVLGAWAGIVPFIGPYLNFAFTPAPSSTWHWTADRGWLNVLPGAAAVLAGLILLFAANRVVLMFASWLGIAAGAWLIVDPVLASQVSLNAGLPDPAATPGVKTLLWLFFYYAVGAAIVFFASLALGRVSVHSVRDARIAQRRVEAATAREEERRRREDERRRREEEERFAAEHDRREPITGGPVGAPATTDHTGAPATTDHTVAPATTEHTVAPATTEHTGATSHERAAGEGPGVAPTESTTGEPAGPAQRREYPPA